MSYSSISLKLELTHDRILEAISTETELNIPNNLKWPCSICNKNVTTNMKGLRCDTYKWCHIKCDGMSPE